MHLKKKKTEEKITESMTEILLEKSNFQDFATFLTHWTTEKAFKLALFKTIYRSTSRLLMKKDMKKTKVVEEFFMVSKIKWKGLHQYKQEKMSCEKSSACVST